MTARRTTGVAQRARYGPWGRWRRRKAHTYDDGVFVPLTFVVLAATVVLALLAAVATGRGRPIDNAMFYLMIVIEVLLVLQLIVGIATSGSAAASMNTGVFIAYLVGLLIVLPVAGFWAIAERQSRWGTSVLLLAAVGLAIMVGRVLQLWNGHP